MTATAPLARNLARDTREGRSQPGQELRRALYRARELGKLDAFVHLAGTLPADAPAGPLCGVPVGIEDTIFVRGMPCRAGSLMLEDFEPPIDAAVVEALLAAGAQVVGKTRVDEFGQEDDENEHGPRHPGHPQVRLRGSGAGAVAAVAAGVVPVALATDGGGAVRRSAAACGVAAYKPTRDAVSREGVIMGTSSLDEVAVVARDIEDLQLVAGTLSETAAAAPAGSGVTLGHLGRLPDGLRAAVQSLGWNLRECRELLPHLEKAPAAHAMIQSAEISSNLARFDGTLFGYRDEADEAGHVEAAIRARSQGFGTALKAQILLGTHVLSAGQYDGYFEQARKVRQLLVGELERLFETVDLLLLPVGKGSGEAAGIVPEQAAHDLLANLAGLPAVTLPGGGPAAGVQLMGPQFSDGELLERARELAAAADDSR
mgnify:FL=1